MDVLDNNSICAEEWNNSLRLYVYSVIGSVAFTLFCVTVRCCLPALRGSPSLSAQLDFVSGALKFALNLVIVLVLIPACPENCECSGKPTMFYIFPTVAAVLGLVWIHRGCRDRQRAQEILEEKGDALVFESVPTVEMA